MRTVRTHIRMVSPHLQTIAFFPHIGLAHCRHLRTVRTHLSGLVHPVIISGEGESTAKDGLTEDTWLQLFDNDVVSIACGIYSVRPK